MKIFFIVLAVCIAVPAQAQNASMSPWFVGIDLRGSLPTGDFNEVASFGFGGTAYAGYSFSPSVAVTGRTGYIFTGGKEVTGTSSGVTGTIKTNYNIFPVLGGLKVFFTGGDTRMYAAGEAGLFVLSATADLKNSSGNTLTNASTSQSKFGYSPAVGAQFRAGEAMMVDAHIDYTGISADEGTLSWVSFAVGIEWTLN